MLACFYYCINCLVGVVEISLTSTGSLKEGIGQCIDYGPSPVKMIVEIMLGHWHQLLVFLLRLKMHLINCRSTTVTHFLLISEN